MRCDDLQVFRLTVPPEERLDLALQEGLAEAGRELSRSQVQKLLRQGLVKDADGSVLLKPGISFTVQRELELLLPIDAPAAEPEPVEDELDIVFEDQYLLVVNKPRGMPTHPSAGHNRDTLVNVLLHRYGADGLSACNGPGRPGIVHRLDMDTTGLIIVAKDDETHQRLAEALADRKIKRIYAALLVGVPEEDSGTIDAPLVRSQDNPLRWEVSAGGRRAITYYSIIKRYENYSLVQAELLTGRTHQIRVHMAYIGFPIFGDIRYGLSQKAPDDKAALPALSGQALHAARLIFIHPRTGAELDLSVELPADFSNLLKHLE